MKNGLRWLDSDMHLAEPWNLWQDYVEPELRERVPELTGIEPGHQPLLHGPTQNIIDIHKERLGEFTQYLRPDGNAVDPEGQLRAMDREGIDMAVLFPTVGLASLPADPPGAAMALRRAYNDWLHDFCSYDPARLKLNAMIAVHDIETAVAEIRRCKTELGAVAICMDQRSADVGFDDPSYEPIWAEAEKLNLAVGFHNGIRGQMEPRFERQPSHLYTHAISRPAGHMTSFMELLYGGVLERHPKLRVSFLEAGASWVGYWLFRLEEEWERFCEVHPGLGEKVKMPPKEYWKRQCFCSVEVEEWSLPGLIAVMGDNNWVVSSDFPHFDCEFPEAGNHFLALEGVSTESKRKIMWDNCARLYNLN